MKLLVALAVVAVIGMVSARPQNAPEVTVIQSVREIKEDGSFTTILELSDGTLTEQRGQIKNPQEQDPEKKIYEIKGLYRFTDAKTGEVTELKYVADENGYQPESASLPVAPQPI